jgi:nitrite reductase/ring-hydroxylating ferredoxin subunit
MGYVKVGQVTDIERESGRLFIVNNEKIAIFNTSGRFFAVQAACPHKGVLLSSGELDDCKVTCNAHGWQFDLETGEGCIIPAKLKKYSLMIKGDDLFLEI